MRIPNEVVKKMQKRLQTEKQKTEKRIASIKEQDPFSDPERLIDNAASDTEAKEESSHERMEALEKELKLYLEEVESALQRIRKGVYGICQNCRKTIKTDRLEIKPTAEHCMECIKK